MRSVVGDTVSAGPRSERQRPHDAALAHDRPRTAAVNDAEA